jgi:prophage regulatory protein
MARPLKPKLATEDTYRGSRSKSGTGSESIARGALQPEEGLEQARLERLPAKFIRFATVRDRTGLSRSTIWRLERGGNFPKHRRISANAVAWIEEEVADWIRSKIDEIAV